MIKEIQILRPLLIMGVIIGHCFCIYNASNNSWPNTIGVEPIQFYNYLNPFFISLGTFVMIMGYLFAYKTDKYLAEGNIKFIWMKFVRLYVPCVFFSLLYAVLFLWNDIHTLTISNIAKVLLFGAGHMWFLPMTFAVYTILKLIQPIVDKWPTLTLLASVCLVPFSSYVPDQILAYLPFIILGYTIYGHTDRLDKYVWPLLCLWIVMFALRIYVTEHINISKVSLMMRFLTNLTSALAFWGVAMKASKHISERYFRLIKAISGCAFGAYLIQEFLIRGLLYHTPIHLWVNSLLYPWVLALIVVPAAFGLSYLGNKTKVGRLLLS